MGYKQIEPNMTFAEVSLLKSRSQIKSLNAPLSGHFRESLSIDQPKKFLALTRP